MRYLLLLLVLALCITIIVIFQYTQHRLHQTLNIHSASDAKTFPEDIKPETHFVTTADNQKIAYWYLPVPKPKAVVILVHGYRNPGGKNLMIDHALYLREAGYTTALVDLRSHGESDGNKIYLGTQEWQDLEAVFDSIKQKVENRQLRIGYLGISMGASTALVAQGKTGKGDFVIASVPFKNPDSLFEHQIKREGLPPLIYLPFMKLAAKQELGENYNQHSAETYISKITVPTLFISATLDNDVNPQDAVDLYNQAPEPKELWIAESEHDVFYFRKEEFKAKVLLFLESVI